MNSTYRALMTAGFNRTNFPKLRDVMFITEPEAAAVYTARHYRDELAQTTLRVCSIRQSWCYIVKLIKRRRVSISYYVMLGVAQ